VPGGAAFTLADVMGKGLGAAIVAAGVRAVLRSTAKHADPTDGLDAASVAFDSEIDGSPNFVTMFHFRLAANTGRISYVDAGHGLASVVDRDGVGKRLVSRNLPLGVQDPGAWTKQRLILRPGDSMVVVSDGVLDAMGGSLDALEEVETMVWEAPSASAAVDEVLYRVQDLGADDDATVMVLRRDED
jgi:serine phosphatase RsbU (regulator of sigma subunit)